MRKKFLIQLSLVAILLMVASVAFAELPVWPVKGKVVCRLSVFDNPEGAIVSMCGNYLFVSNSCTAKVKEGFYWVEGRGSISKLEIGPYGDLKMIDRQFVAGLTGPLGMAILNVDTGKFAAGTLFAMTGSAPMSTVNGTPITDPRRHKPKIIAINPANGAILGEISMGANSVFAKISGGPADLLNALAFDAKGNLYMADTGWGHDSYKPAFKYAGGVWKIPIESIDGLAAGSMNPPKMPQFIPCPSWPDGIEVDPITQKVWWNTVMPPGAGDDPYKGAYWAVTDADFDSGILPAPLQKGLGRLDGCAFTVKGTNLQTEILNTPNAIVVVRPSEPDKPYRLATDPEIVLEGPADLNLKTLGDGSYLLFVPELMAVNPTQWDERLTVIWLPADFDSPQ
ncbi:MAG: hypothetical protein V1878_02155 [bacterium]